MKTYSRVLISSFAKVGTQTIASSLKNKSFEHVQSIIRIKKMIETPNQLLICGIRDLIGRNMSYFFKHARIIHIMMCNVVVMIIRVNIVIWVMWIKYWQKI